MKRAFWAVSVACGLFAVLIAVLWAFGLPVGASLSDLFAGSFGDEHGMARTLVRATPLLMCALGTIVAWRARMFNIGGEGQYVVGGVCGAAAANLVNGLPGPILTVAVLLFSVIGGAAYAWLAGVLQVKRGVQVVVSTILLNFIALQILSFMVNGPLQESGRQNPMTDPLPRAAMLMRFDPQTDLHVGTMLAALVALSVFVFLFHSKEGFRLRLVGVNAEAARIAGVDVGRTQIRAMALSGALCGLAGGVDFAGFIGRVGLGFSQDWGFLAIPVAIVGGLHPLGAVLSAVFFGALFAGSENLAMFNTVGATVVYVIQAVAVLAFISVASNMRLTRRTQEGT